MRIPARIIHVRTNTQLAAFEEIGHDLPVLPRNCDRECTLEQMGRHAAVLARDLAVALSEKIKSLDGGRTARAEDIRGPAARCGGMPTGYTLVFEGFSDRDKTFIEEQLASFRDQCAVRPLRITPTTVSYWYETHADIARINRNIRLMIDLMDQPTQISLAGNTIRSVRIPTR
jgi:hypothetical protein